MDYLSLICFWFGFGIGAYLTNREMKNPGWIRSKIDSLVAKLRH